MYYKIADLKNLVKSLSGAEKKYFKLFSDAFIPEGKEAMYIQLFDGLSGLKTELPEFQKGTSKEAMTTAKKRLFKNILRSLRIYHEGQSVETVIQNLLTEVEILFRLSLPRQSLFQLNKAATLAKQHEKFRLLLQVLEWERRLNIVLDKPTRPNPEIRNEEKQVLAKLNQLMELEAIYSRAKELKKQYGYIKGITKKGLNLETIAAPEMPEEAKCLSNKAVYYFNFIHALYYWMTFNHSRAYEYSRHLLMPTIQIVLPDDYVDGILEHVTSCVCLGKFDAALHGLEVGAAYIEDQKLDQSHSFNSKMFYYEVSYHIIIYNYTGNLAKLKKTIAAAEEKLKRYDQTFSLETKQVILANLMNANLGIGNLDKVNELWESLFRKQSQSERRDIYDDLYLFRLFNLIQNGSHWLIRSMASSAFRYFKPLKTTPSHFALELKIAALLQKDIDFDKPESKANALMQMKEIVADYMASFNGFQEQYTLYAIWIESLISGQPFYLEARKWYKNFLLKSRR